MRPDSSQGPDDRHEARGEKGERLSAVMGEGQFLKAGDGEGRGGKGGQAEAQEGLHTRQTPNVLLSLCLLALGTPTRDLGAKSKTAPRSRVGEQSRRACRGLRMKETLPVAGGRAGSTRPRPGSPRLRMDRPHPVGLQTFVKHLLSVWVVLGPGDTHGHDTYPCNFTGDEGPARSTFG